MMKQICKASLDDKIALELNPGVTTLYMRLNFKLFEHPYGLQLPKKLGCNKSLLCGSFPPVSFLIRAFALGGRRGLAK